MMTQFERNQMTRDLQRALEIQANAKKRAQYAQDPRIAKRLETSCAQLAETISLMHGDIPKLQLADLVDA